MSRAPQTSISKGAIPKQKSTGKPQKTKPMQKGVKSKKEPSKPDVVEWQLPAFSVPPPKKKPEINWERLKKDTARRHAPEGEDIKEIRRILKEVKEVNVPVHEFINMVSPYTGDNGTALRAVMSEDLESFRKLAKKVYETMTQDVSDVLVNEQLQMVQYYEEKNSQLSDKMMWSINEIYEMAQDFDFEQFMKNKDEYLQMLFPLPREADATSDESYDMMKRQQAFHRLQWLRSEGERMSEENKRLKKRLEELKKEQQEEQNKAAEQAAEAETQRQQLAQEEINMKEKLEELNESIEKSFIREERKITKEHNKLVRLQPPDEGPSAATGAVRKKSSTATMKKSRQRKPDWSSTTAADIEVTEVKKVAAAESLKKIASQGSGVKRPKSRARPPHFSPIKTPPRKEPPPEDSDALPTFGRPKKKKAERKPPSPFHYSPPKTPPPDWENLDEAAAFGRTEPAPPPTRTSPFHYSPPKSPPQKQETIMQETTTTVHQRRPQPRIRQSRAPRDTWGGFG